jgi:hypothetical protein
VPAGTWFAGAMTTPSDQTPPPAERADRTRIGLIAAAVAVVVLAIVLAAILVADDDELTTVDSTTSTSSTTTATSTSTSTSSSTTSSRPSTTSTTLPAGEVTDEEAATIVWPAPGGGTTYDDPADATEAFATDLVGFTDPIVGDVQQGDSRSGEVEVRSVPDGPVTTVLVREMGDGNWYVIGATTPDIEVDDPVAGTAIDTPLLVAGRARAFEGTVQVAVYERGSGGQLGSGFVTGSGSGELGPFSGSIDWDNPVGGWGNVVFWTSSAEDGRVLQAVAIPVGFIGGD